MTRVRRHGHALSLMLLLLAQAPRLAHAIAPGSPAHDLFDEGRKLVEQGDYRAACPKFEQSLRLEVGVGTQFNLADCWEHIGKTASARALFLGAAASAKAASQSEREQVLRERAQALESRVARLVVEVRAPEPRMIVKRDDLPIDEGDFGKAVALDPATYRISARAPGKKTWTKTLHLEANAEVVTVEVPALEAEDAVDAPPRQPPTAKIDQTTPAAPAPRPLADTRGPYYAPIILSVVGVGGIVAGAVTGLRYLSANSDAKAICPASTRCSETDVAEHSRLLGEARSARVWSYAGFGVGAFALGGAAAVYLLGNMRDQKSGASLRVAPLVARDGWGAVVERSF